METFPPFGRRKNLAYVEKESNYGERNASFLLGIGDLQLKIGCSVARAIVKTFKKAGSSN